MIPTATVTSGERARAIHPWQSVLLFAIAFWAGAFISQHLSVSNSPYVPFWLPTGLYTGVLLLNEMRKWPRFLLGALLGNLAFDLPHGTPFLTLLGFYSANTLHAAVSARALQRFGNGVDGLSHLKGFLALLFWATGVGSALGAFAGAGTLVASGMSHSFWAAWRTWAGNAAMATGLLLPMILAWFRPGHQREKLFDSRLKMAEGAALIAMMSVLTWYLLVLVGGILSPYKVLLLSFLLWAGIRFGLRGVTFANVWLGILMAFLTTHYMQGLSAEQIASGLYVDVLQMYLAVASLISLVPTIVMNERNESLRNLAESEFRSRQMAQEVTRTQKYYQTLLSTASDGIHIMDAAGNLVEASDSFYRMLGYDPRNPPKLGVWDWDAQWSQAELKQRMERHLTMPEVFETVHRRKNGETLAVEISVRKVELDGQGFIYGASRNITERKLAEARLRERENQLQIFVTHSPAAIAMLDKEMRYVAVSQRWLEDFKLESANVVGRTHYEVFPEIPKHWRQIHQRCLAGAIEKNDNDVFLRADGRKEYLRWEIRPWHDATGVTGGIIIFTEGITARKEAEEKIREQARLIEEARDAIILRDLNGAILMWNHGAEAIFGWSAAEAIGKTPPELGKYGMESFRSCTAAVIEHGVWNGQIPATTKDGRQLEIESRWTLLRDENGQPQKILSISHDVTAQKKMEAQLLRAARMQTIGTLSSGVAHDLNNILAPFLVGLPILREETSSAETREMLEMMETSIQRGADIVKQLLLFGRGGETKRLPVNLVRQVRDVTKIIHETFPKNLNLETFTPTDLWLVMADPTQIYQVLLNLAVNARDAMPGGGTLFINLKNERLDRGFDGLTAKAKPGDYVVLTVRDTGTGMSPEITSHIFDPFFTTKELGKGTGLGLSVVLGVVEDHGGFIDVQSTPGKGSEFKIHLPALPLSQPRPECNPETDFPKGNGEMILVVDDEPAIMRVVGKILERFGYHPLMTHGVDAALALCAQNPAILAVVSDYSMPGKDGLVLTRAMQTEFPGIKVIIASGLGETLDHEALKALGVQAVLKKPFETKALLEALRQALAKPAGSS